MTYRFISILIIVFHCLVDFNSAFAEGTEQIKVPQRFRAKDFVVFFELDELPRNIIEWNKKRAEVLYIIEGKPHIIFSGFVDEDYDLVFGKTKIPVTHGRFDFRFILPLDSTTIPLTIIDSREKEFSYRFLVHWIEIPPQLRFKVKELQKKTEKTLGLSGLFRRAAFTQLYSEGTPVHKVDLDSQQHSKLNFRILSSADEEFDGWLLTIRDSNNNIIAKKARYGNPPSYLDWREVSQHIQHKGIYTYRVDLFYAGRIYDGKVNQFEAVEGHSLLTHKYSPAITVHPEGGFGFLFYEDKRQKFSRVYMHFDFPIVILNRFIARIGGLASLHEDGSDQLFTFTRMGGGIRLYSSNKNPLLGDPVILRIDTLLSINGYTTPGPSPSAGSVRYSHPALLIEPHILLWSYHYFIPWVEYGLKPDRSQEHISIGLNYMFHIRPWSVNWGLGIVWNRLISFPRDPDSEYSVFRTLMRFIWFM